MLDWFTQLLAFVHTSPLRARNTFCTSCPGPGPLTNSAPFASCTQEVYEQFVAKDLTEAPCACCNSFCRTEGTVVVRVDDADVDVNQLLQQLKPATSAPEALPDMLRQQFNVGGELQDYLLSPHGVIATDEHGAAVAINICGTCHASLQKNHLPQNSLRNGNASFAQLCPELAACTEAEKRFLCLNSPGAKLICIGKSPGRSSMVGHSFCVVNDLQMAVDAVFPRSLKAVQDEFVVAFAGEDDSPEAIAALTKYRIRRSVIRAALEWLIAHNPLYAGIVICEAALAALPEETGPASTSCALVRSDNADAAVQIGEVLGYAEPSDLTDHGFAIADNLLLQGQQPTSRVRQAEAALDVLLRARTRTAAPPQQVMAPQHHDHASPTVEDAQPTANSAAPASPPTPRTPAPAEQESMPDDTVGDQFLPLHPPPPSWPCLDMIPEEPASWYLLDELPDQPASWLGLDDLPDCPATIDCELPQGPAPATEDDMYPTGPAAVGQDEAGGAGDDIVVLPSSQFASASDTDYLYKTFPFLFPFARGAHGDPARKKPMSSQAVTLLKLDDCTRAYGKDSAFVFDRYRCVVCPRCCERGRAACVARACVVLMPILVLVCVHVHGCMYARSCVPARLTVPKLHVRFTAITAGAPHRLNYTALFHRAMRNRSTR